MPKWALGCLEGAGKRARHLKLRSVDEVLRKAVTGWVRVVAKLARENGTTSPRVARFSRLK